MAGKLHVPHVQSCPPADVLQLLLRVAGNSGPRGSSDGGAGDGYGKDTVPAGVRRRNAAGPSGWAEDSARTPGVLRPSIASPVHFDSKTDQARSKAGLIFA